MTTLTRAYALAIGLAFILAGISAFIPLFTTQPDANAPELLLDAEYAYLLGLFPVNLVHNLFHLITGVAGVWASRNQQRARQYCQGLSLLLAGFAVMGMLPGLSTALGLMPLFGHDVWLHLLEAGIAGYLGFFETRWTDAAPDAAKGGQR